MQYINYNISVVLVTKSGFQDILKPCNSLMFTNTGLDIVEVNGMVLYPGVPGTSLGDSRTIGGNEGEVFVGTIKVTFRSLVGPQLEMVQKSYA
jgi:hypothetical protein